MSGQPPQYGGGYGPPPGQDPYAQGGYPQPAPAAAPPPARRGLTPLGRIGMLLIAAGAAAFAIAGFTDIIASPGGLPRVEGDTATVVIGAIVAVLALAAAALPQIWLHLAAITAGVFAAMFAGIALIGAKTNEVFDFAPEPELKAGAYLAILGFALGMIGVFVALAGLIHTTPQQPATAPPGSAGRSNYSIASLVLAILGLLLVPLAALGMGFGILGLEDHRRSGGALAGKGLSTAGIIVSLVALVGYTIGIAIGIPVAESGS